MTNHEILSIVEALAVISASIAAIIGINSWRREARWKRKAEVAEEVLLAFHRIKSVFDIIRSPAVFSAHSALQGNARLKEMADVTVKRYHENIEAFVILRTLRWKYRVVFPDSDESPFQEVESLLRKVLASSYLLGRKVWPRQGSEMPDDVFQEHLKEMTDLESWHWLMDEETDPLNKRLNQAIGAIQSSCGKYLA